LWKVPDQVNETKSARLVAKLNNCYNVFATREIRKQFLDKYYAQAKISKCFLRNIYKSLMGDCSAAVSADERAVDDRVAEALFQLNDPAFIYDLRKLNGNPGSTKFDTFWEELGSYIEELTPAVDDRRHSDVPQMPVAISLRHLLNIVNRAKVSR